MRAMESEEWVGKKGRIESRENGVNIVGFD
jgi:hypothetical protein